MVTTKKLIVLKNLKHKFKRFGFKAYKICVTKRKVPLYYIGTYSPSAVYNVYEKKYNFIFLDMQKFSVLIAKGWSINGRLWNLLIPFFCVLFKQKLYLKYYHLIFNKKNNILKNYEHRKYKKNFQIKADLYYYYLI